jgi:hypothetical protein
VSLPHFLIAGVPKAGTTALHAALVPHPDLYLSKVKEPKFFLSDGPPPTRGGPGDAQTYQEHVWRRADYEKLFDPAPPGTLRGEATPFYLYDRASHERIRRLVPDAKLIILLRDPVDRAHSNWTHLWNAGLEPEADFRTACAAEPERRAAGWADFWHYTEMGRYGHQLQHLSKHVRSSRTRRPSPWTGCATSSAYAAGCCGRSRRRTSTGTWWRTTRSTWCCVRCCASAARSVTASRSRSGWPPAARC